LILDPASPASVWCKIRYMKGLNERRRRIRQISSWVAVLAFVTALGGVVYGWRARTIGPFKECVHPCHDTDCCDDEYADTARWWLPWLPIGAALVVGVASVGVRARMRESTQD
jgi:hypothetical protein